MKLCVGWSTAGTELVHARLMAARHRTGVEDLMTHVAAVLGCARHVHNPTILRGVFGTDVLSLALASFNPSPNTQKASNSAPPHQSREPMQGPSTPSKTSIRLSRRLPR